MASVLASKMGLNSLRRKQAKTFNVTVVTMDADLEFSCEVSSFVFKCYVFLSYLNYDRIMSLNAYISGIKLVVAYNQTCTGSDQCFSPVTGGHVSLTRGRHQAVDILTSSLTVVVPLSKSLSLTCFSRGSASRHPCLLKLL